MQESFSTPLQEIPVHRIGPVEQGFGIFDNFKGNQIRQPLSPKFPSQQQQIQIIDKELAQVQSQLEERLYGPKKFRETNKTGQSRVVSVERTSKGFKVRLLARHFYDPGEVRMKQESLKKLDTIIQIVKDLERDVTVEGHTDSIPKKEGYNNWEISALRATHVLKYMVSEHSFPQSRLSAVGYADLRPIAHNGTSSGRRLNRRIEIHVNYED